MMSPKISVRSLMSKRRCGMTRSKIAGRPRSGVRRRSTNRNGTAGPICGSGHTTGIRQSWRVPFSGLRRRAQTGRGRVARFAESSQFQGVAALAGVVMAGDARVADTAVELLAPGHVGKPTAAPFVLGQRITAVDLVEEAHEFR